MTSEGGVLETAPPLFDVGDVVEDEVDVDDEEMLLSANLVLRPSATFHPSSQRSHVHGKANYMSV